MGSDCRRQAGDPRDIPRHDILIFPSGFAELIPISAQDICRHQEFLAGFIYFGLE